MNEEERNLLDRVLLAKEIVSNNSQINPEQYVSRQNDNTDEIKPIPLPTFVYSNENKEIKETK